MRTLPPTGFPLDFVSIASAAGGFLSRGTEGATSAFGQALSRRLPGRQIVFLDSGRGALVVLLRAMAALHPDRDEVVIPDYTCYTVPSAVVAAGLRVQPCDLRPETLDLDPQDLSRCLSHRTLALIACSLLGYPADLPGHNAAAQRHGAYLIDDAAQAFGGSVGGLACGAWGTAGILSFSRGKHLPLCGGGLLAMSGKELASNVQQEVGRLPRRRFRASLAAVAAQAGYRLLSTPALFGLASRIPVLEVGVTAFRPHIVPGRMTGFQAALGSLLLQQLDPVNESRRLRARRLQEALADLPGLRFAAPSVPGTLAVPLRLPVLVAGRERRGRVLKELAAAGLGSSVLYPGRIGDIAELQNQLAPGARERSRLGAAWLSESLITLPVHHYVRPRDQQAILGAFRRALGR